MISLWTAPAALLVKIILDDRRTAWAVIRGLLRSPLAWVFALIPSIYCAFYYLNFGTISIIGSTATDLQLLSPGHFVSFWFDLDQGVFVGVPWLLPIIVVFLVRFRGLSRQCRIDFLTALVGALLICLPLLAQTAINPGQSVFARYALYAVTPLVAWAGWYLTEVLTARAVSWALVAASTLYALGYGGPLVGEDYLVHKPWTKFILEHFPAWYNPEPGIFFARTNGKEWAPATQAPAVLVTPSGIITKILLPLSNGDAVLAKLCSGQLLNPDGTPLRAAQATDREYGWGYLNGQFTCSGLKTIGAIDLGRQYHAAIDSSVVFSRPDFPDFVTFVSGVSSVEQWGR